MGGKQTHFPTSNGNLIVIGHRIQFIPAVIWGIKRRDAETSLPTVARLVSTCAANRRVWRDRPADDGGEFGATIAERKHHSTGGELVAFRADCNWAAGDCDCGRVGIVAGGHHCLLVVAPGGTSIVDAVW